jgi:hypothetical protein
MMWRRSGLKLVAVVAAVVLAVGLMAPLAKQAEAGQTFIPFLAVGGGFTCGIFVINFFGAGVRITVDTAVSSRRTNTVTTFDLAAFEGLLIDCAGLTGGGSGTQNMTVFLSQAASLPPQAFAFMVLPAQMGGGLVVPPNMFLFT